ncbi:MAG: 5-formyltetrahydrofolate cyclo-ligase [Candidatus Kapaibacterium sp.]
MTLDPIIAQRSELRKKALELRDGIPADIRDAYSQLIRKKTVEFLESISARFVHSYIGFRSEVVTKGIIEDLLERGINLVVPVVRQEKMVHSLLEDLDQLCPGNFGVPEPVNVKEISLTGLDAVIIPVVAFDGFGMRLGYGKGYYDRFLTELPSKVRRIGLAFSNQEMDIIPIMSHDQLMNITITEQSTFFFK